MNTIKKHYLPYFRAATIINTVYISVFLLLNFAFDININNDTSAISLILLIIYFIVGWIFLNRRYIKPYKIKGNRLNDLLTDITILLTLLSGVVFAHGLIEKCHKSETVENIQDIGKPKPLTYYTVKDFHINDSLIVDVCENWQRAGRQEKHNINVYLASPFITKVNLNTDFYSYWLCMKFNTDISGKPDNEYIEKIKSIFLNETKYKWKNNKIQTEFMYLKAIKPNNNYYTLSQKISQVCFYKNSEGESKKLPEERIIILMPEKEPFAERGNTSLLWGTAFCLGSLFLYHIFIANRKNDDAQM